MKTQDGARCDRRGESMDLPQTKDVQRRLQHRPRGTGAHVMNKHSLAIADPTGWPPHGKPPRSVQPGHKLARSSIRGRTRLAARRGMHSPAMPRGLPLRRAHAPCLPDRDELTVHGVDLWHRARLTASTACAHAWRGQGLQTRHLAGALACEGPAPPSRI